jgi:hypothetical protein
MQRWPFAVLFSIALFVLALPLAATAQEGRPPTLTTQATPSATLGEPISDTATLSGGDNPTGTITFHLWPSLEDCNNSANEVDTGLSPVTVDGNDTYPSGDVDTTNLALGTYYWTADYSGDANNDAVPSECNAPNEQSVVNEGGGGGGGGGGGSGGGNGGGRNNIDGRHRHHDRDRDRHHDRDRHNNRFFGRGDFAGGAAHRQYERIVEERVIKETIPNKGTLANTGGMPLAGVAFLSLAMVGLGISVLRSAIRPER